MGIFCGKPWVADCTFWHVDEYYTATNSGRMEYAFGLNQVRRLQLDRTNRAGCSHMPVESLKEEEI
jgi:hypothetical protein